VVIDAHALDLEHGITGEHEDAAAVPKVTLASMYAIDAFVEALPSLRETRAEIQRRRRRGDHELLALFKLPLHPNIAEPSFVDAFPIVMDAFDVPAMLAPRRRIAIATGDSLTPAMAGPAIRAWQIARALSKEHEVRLVSTVRAELTHPDFEVSLIDQASMAELEAWCDVFVFQGYIMWEYPAIRDSKKIVVCDIYDPFHLEQLEQARDLGEEERRNTVLGSALVLNQQLSAATSSCAPARSSATSGSASSPRSVGSTRRTTTSPDLSGLIQLAPFGVSDEPPCAPDRRSRAWCPASASTTRSSCGAAASTTGSTRDAPPCGRQAARSPTQRAAVLPRRLQHPNPGVPEMRMAVEARTLANELGLVGTHVFFNEAWVAYDDRQNYLLDADIGVSTHFHHVETEFSFRTRILDYLWAGLPIVTTGGDSLAAEIEARPIGLTVPAEDVGALEEALFRLLDDRELAERCRANARVMAAEHTWSQVLEPLVAFCREPRRAPDLLGSIDQPTVPPRRPWRERGGWRQDVKIVQHVISEGGPALLARKAAGRARRVLGTPSGS
jgi:hypothetical protein